MNKIKMVACKISETTMQTNTPSNKSIHPCTWAHIYISPLNDWLHFALPTAELRSRRPSSGRTCVGTMLRSEVRQSPENVSSETVRPCLTRVKIWASVRFDWPMSCYGNGLFESARQDDKMSRWYIHTAIRVRTHTVLQFKAWVMLGHEAELCFSIWLIYIHEHYKPDYSWACQRMGRMQGNCCCFRCCGLKFQFLF